MAQSLYCLVGAKLTDEFICKVSDTIGRFDLRKILNIAGPGSMACGRGVSLSGRGSMSDHDPAAPFEGTGVSLGDLPWRERVMFIRSHLRIAHHEAPNLTVKPPQDQEDSSCPSQTELCLW